MHNNSSAKRSQHWMGAWGLISIPTNVTNIQGLEGIVPHPLQPPWITLWLHRAIFIFTNNFVLLSNIKHNSSQNPYILYENLPCNQRNPRSNFYWEALLFLMNLAPDCHSSGIPLSSFRYSVLRLPRYSLRLGSSSLELRAACISLLASLYTALWSLSWWVLECCCCWVIQRSASSILTNFNMNFKLFLMIQICHDIGYHQ